MALVFAASIMTTVSYAKDNSWTGYLCDAACGGGFAKLPAKQGLTKAQTHPKSCDMKTQCAAAGYGLYSKGKFYPFDKSGNAQATAWLSKTTKDTGLMVTVTGTIKDKTITVTSINDAPSKTSKN